MTDVRFEATKWRIAATQQLAGIAGIACRWRCNSAAIVREGGKGERSSQPGQKNVERSKAHRLRGLVTFASAGRQVNRAPSVSARSETCYHPMRPPVRSKRLFALSCLFCRRQFAVTECTRNSSSIHCTLEAGPK